MKSKTEAKTVPIMSPFMNPREAAAFYRTTVVSLARYRADGRGPAFIRMGKRVLYPRPVIEGLPPDLSNAGEIKLSDLIRRRA